jgi:ubiquinone/menaquinone biosynthesis C-methylase UbiE
MKNKYLNLVLAGETLTRDQHVEYMREFHNSNTDLSELYFSRPSEYGISTYEVLRDAINIPKTEEFRILDLGCSVGTFCNFLDLSENLLLTYTGIDVSDESLRTAKSRYQNRAEFINAAADSLPFADNIFDAVVSHMAFSMFKPIHTAMQESIRVLKKGGVFSIILPAVWSKCVNPNIELSVGVRRIISEVYPNYARNYGGFGEPEFFSKESIMDFCSKFKELSISSLDEFEVDFSGSVEEIIWGIKTFYWYQILSDELKASIEQKIVDMVSGLTLVDGKINHCRKMAILMCVKN